MLKLFYLEFLRLRTVKTSSEITKLLKMKSGDGENDPEVDFFLLSDVCAEDKELRMHLQLSKLEHVLAVQEKERNNVEFKRACFFCRMEFEGSHSKLLDHMAFDHNFRFVMLKMHLDELISEDIFNCENVQNHCPSTFQF